MDKIRVLIADRFGLVRAGLKLLINSQADMEVVAEAADGAEAVELALRARADIALVDLSLPSLPGLKVIELIRRACPRTQAIVLTMLDDASYVGPALAAGAAAYLVKGVSETDLFSAIRAVRAGATLVIRSAVHGGARQPVAGDVPGVRTGARGRAPKLSGREREVLWMIATGHTHREVAEKLGINPKTVDTYRLRLSRKLGLRRRAELVRYAFQMGLVTDEQLSTG